MSRIFDAVELTFLTEGERKLARLATVCRDGMPHVVPTGFGYNREADAIDIGGHQLERTKKYRDVVRTGVAALVVDDVLPPWQPRGIEIRGRAEPIEAPEPLIRVHPERVVTWGLTGDQIGVQHRRDV